MNTLDNLKKYTTIVVDTGDFQSIKQYRPQDATTNPSLIFKAAQKPQYQPFIQQIIQEHPSMKASQLIDPILVLFGCEILKIIPGRVSTEVDARLSFDTKASVKKAQYLISLYEKAGVHKERVLIKLASTWEGIQAARQLEAQGIHCNLTLLFSFIQAVACAQAKVQLISPFVGRIYDWYKKTAGDQWQEEKYRGIHDPGVQSVTKIYQYYKTHNYKTEIMGASFRNIDQILALSGCDLLTISPELLQQLQTSSATITQQLSPKNVSSIPLIDSLDEATFRYQMNQDAMATEKLAEGIRLFAKDTEQFEQLIAQLQTK